MVKDKDFLQHEIVKNRLQNSKKYSQLAKNLGFRDIKAMTKMAVQNDNLNALMGIAQSNIYAATAELSNPEYGEFFSQKYKAQQDAFIPKLYFMIRSHAPAHLKKLLQRLTRSIILRTSLNISGRGSRGKSRHRIPYHPGIAEFDLDRTIFNYIQGKCILNYGDIVGVERRQKKRNVVLILDTSGSMFGTLLLNAALTTSVLSYAMEKDYTSVVIFAGEPYLLKNIKETRAIAKLVDQILESEAVGFTNITNALKLGLRQLKKMQGQGGRKSVGILITDGDYNRGRHPAEYARFFPELHVINLPPEESKEHQTRGQAVCRQIAEAGRGYYMPVSDVQEIPRTLMSLLSKI